MGPLTGEPCRTAPNVNKATLLSGGNMTSQALRAVFARRRRSSAACILALCSVLLALAPDAQAQVAVDQFQPGLLASDGFAIARPTVLRKGGWGVQLVAEYANDSLVLESSRPPITLSVVEDHLVLHPGFAVALGGRFTAFASLPVHVLMRGEDPGTFASEADGGGIGDLGIGGRVWIAGSPTARGMFSAEFIARVPSAELANDDQSYSGDEIGSYEPALIGEVHLGRFDARLRVGTRLRASTSVGGVSLGSALTAGLGARVMLVKGLYAHAELYGGSSFESFGERASSPLELLLGLKHQIRDLFIGAAAGPGLVAGYGSPDVRVVFTIGYAPLEPEEEVPTPAPSDRDGDGILDGRDRCPTYPEDADGFEDADGCPDPDNDRDGVLDAQDMCPVEAEDVDGFDDANGCPDPDNDGDGLLDAQDACPTDPEDKDGFEDENGCPDLDNDRDGVPDVDDACPVEAGTAAQKGCPGAVRIDAEKGQLVILERVEFEVNKDVILAVSEGLLTDVASIITTHPELKKLRVEGHTDAVGKDAKNLELSTRRARSVARWLIQHGVAADRIEAYGCGETRALGSNDTDEGRQQNRRVEFHIIDPAPAELRSAEGCREASVK
jgi:outer membrane protein OmpA-like peptidoglycan-associated protein